MQPSANPPTYAAGLARRARDQTVAGLVVLVLVAMIALLAAGGGYMAWARWHAARTDPNKVALPQPARPSQAHAYMNGPGKPLRGFLAATSTLPAKSSRIRCAKLASTTLGAFPPPPRLAGLADAVPDPTLADALGNHLDAVLDYLSACGQARDLAEYAKTSRFTAIVATRQLRKVDAA